MTRLVCIGMWIDMLDLVTVSVITMLTVPKVHSLYKVEIDTLAMKL